MYMNGLSLLFSYITIFRCVFHVSISLMLEIYISYPFFYDQILIYKYIYCEWIFGMEMDTDGMTDNSPYFN